MLNGRRLIKACDIPRIATVLGVKADDIYEAGKKGGVIKGYSIREIE